MRYLHFNPKPTPKTNIRWLLPQHLNVINLLKSCSKMKELNQIHAQMIRTGLIQDAISVSQIITFFTVPSAAHFNMDYARRVFDQIDNPNLFIWNSMIRGYTQNCAPKDALLLYKQMLFRGFSPDNHTYPIVTKACSHLRAVEQGKTLHGQVVKCGFESDMFIMSGVVNFYSSCGKIEVARELFDEMPVRDVVSWTTMVSGYVQLNLPEEAFRLFDEMRMSGVKPNKVTLMSLLSACGQLQALERGQQLHSYIVENKIELDLLVSNSLMNMYSRCGSVLNAIEIFNNMPTRNTISWNILIGGVSQSGLHVEAVSLFQEMEQSDVRPNEFTMVSTLSACAQLGDLGQGKLLHAYIKEHSIKSDVFVNNALVNMYAKCGDLENAVYVFRGMPKRDVFSWTAMITGYVQRSFFKEALTLFQEMQLSGVKPNEVTLVGLLSAFAQLGALDQGKWIHAYIEENNVRQDVCLGNALVDMYAKCGCIKSAIQVFHGMPQKDRFSWNAMIGGLAMHGHGREAIHLFTQMHREGNTKPDNVTLMAVLCACTHSGMVQEGYFYFNSMQRLYSITPRVEHYGCMVDLLGKAGLLEEASNFIEQMPIEPNVVILGSLLVACRAHQKMKLGEKVAQRILKLAPDDEGAVVLISNMFAETGRWDDVRRVRALMGSRGMEKSPGCSWIEVNGVLNEFFVGDTFHHQYNLISLVLDSLTLQSKQVIHELSYSEAFRHFNNDSTFAI